MFVFYHVPKTASRILRLQPRAFLYLFISVSILHCTELRLSTLNKEYMMMMMMMQKMRRTTRKSDQDIQEIRFSRS